MNEQPQEQKKLKEPGYYTGMGIAIGAGVGVAIGLALGILSLGIAIGAAIGVAIGGVLEQQAKAKGDVRKLSPEEEKRRKKSAMVAFIVGLVSAVLFAILFVTLARGA